MLKDIIGSIKKAEASSEQLIKKAEARAKTSQTDFEKKREDVLEESRKKNESVRKELMKRAEVEAAAAESRILEEAQQEINKIRAGADKSRDAAVNLIVEKMFDQ